MMIYALQVSLKTLTSRTEADFHLLPSYSGLVIDQARKDEFRVWNIDEIAKKRVEASDGYPSQVLAQEGAMPDALEKRMVEHHEPTTPEKTSRSSQDKSESV